jgi:hypothetical protein
VMLSIGTSGECFGAPRRRMMQPQPQSRGNAAGDRRDSSRVTWWVIQVGLVAVLLVAVVAGPVLGSAPSWA